MCSWSGLDFLRVENQEGKIEKGKGIKGLQIHPFAVALTVKREGA